MKQSARRLSIWSGILLAFSLALGACGTTTNSVPPVQQPGVASTGYCAYGASYYPGGYNSGYYNGPYTAAGCIAGYAYYGGQCVCTSNYNTGGGCPVGYVNGGGGCQYSAGGYGYGYCSPGQYYYPGVGCRYYY